MIKNKQIVNGSFAKLCLGGSTLGWSANLRNSIKILDVFYEKGGRLIDTSDFYSEWVPGNVGGESENFIGTWLSLNSGQVTPTIITKVGLSHKRKGFETTNIVFAAEDSLRRLKRDHIDVYMPHRDLDVIERELWIEAMIKLYKAGKICSVGYSHCSAETIKRTSKILSEEGVPLSIVESNYNLLEFQEARELIDLTKSLEMQFMAARGLAGGFLSGKYHHSRSQKVRVLRGTLSHFRTRGLLAFQKSYRSSMNSASVSRYMNSQNTHKIEKIRSIARIYKVNPSSVVFSWLVMQTGVDFACISFRNDFQARRLNLIPLTTQELKDLSD